MLRCLCLDAKPVFITILGYVYHHAKVFLSGCYAGVYQKSPLVNSSGHSRQVLPLLLEGVQAVLSKVPALMRHNAAFQDLIWSVPCPGPTTVFLWSLDYNSK